MTDSSALRDFRAVLQKWATKAALAAELGVEHGLVQAWWNRNSIPPRWFEAVARAAIKRDIVGVDEAALMRLHKDRFARDEPVAEPAQARA